MKHAFRRALVKVGFTPERAERLADMQQAAPDAPGVEVMFPGECVLRTRQENLTNGIPVDEAAWQAIVNV